MAFEQPDEGRRRPPPPRFFEYGWVDGKTAFAVIAYSEAAAVEARAKGQPAPAPVRLVSLAWPAWSSRGGRLRTFWWQLIDAPRMPGTAPAEPDTLMLVLSPDVTITDSVPLNGGVAGHATQVNVRVVRAAARHLVPQRGEPMRPAMLDPVETYVRAPRAPDDPLVAGLIELPVTEAQMTTEVLVPQFFGFDFDPLSQIEHARILRKPGSCVIRQREGSRDTWRVEIVQEPIEQAGAFAVEVIGLPRPKDSDYTSHYQVRIVASGAVTVRAKQAPFGTIPGLTRDPNPNDTPVSFIDVATAEEGDPARMPDTGWVVADASGFRAVSLATLFTSGEAFAVGTAVAAIEMIPVVGSFVEIGGLIYAAGTGRTWYGEEVTNGDLALMGIFAIVGLLPGVSSAMLKRLQVVGSSLLPGVPLVSLNPGIVPEARVFLSQNGPRLLREYVASLDPKTADEMVASLELALKTGGKTEMAAQIGDLLLRVLPSTHMIDNIPAVQFLEAMKQLPIEAVDGFDDLADDVAAEISAAFATALAGGGALALRRVLESKGLGHLWTSYYDDVTDHLVFRLFTEDFSAIRDPRLTGEMNYEQFFGGFSDYVARKTAAKQAPRAALQWIASVGDSSLAAKLMEAEFGPFWRALLKPYVDLRRFYVEPRLAREFAAFASKPEEYRILRDRVSGKGFGMLFQVDHILEQRFVKAMPDSFVDHVDDFIGFLVPWNRTVAKQLELLGVSEYLYIHAEKTNLMRRLIPYGAEHLMTTQEYFYVYQYVYIKQFGFKDKPFQTSLFHLFDSMNRARLQARVPGEKALVAHFVDDAEELFLLIQGIHAKLGRTLAPL